MQHLRGWLRRGVVPVVLTVACVLGLVGAATAATAPTLPEVVLAQSGHWAVDKATGSVVHVHGGTRQVDARVTLPAEAAADARTALQGDTQGFVVGRDRAWAFDKATLTVDPPIPLPATDERPVGIETPGGPYLVYRGRGTIVRLGAPTAVVEAGGPLGPPVRTNDGTVWVHRPDNAAVCAFRRGETALDCGVRAGTAGGLTVATDVATFVDTDDERARQVRDGALASGSALGADLPADTLLADQTTSTRLPVVDPAPRLRLLDAGGIPTDSPAGVPLDVPLGPGTYSAPLVSGDVVALLELGSSTLLTFTSDGSKVSELHLPAGTTPDDLRRGEDGRIYVDEAGKTHVVGPDGTVTTVDLVGTGVGGTGIAVAAPENQRNPVAPPPPGAVTIPRADPNVLAAPVPGLPPAAGLPNVGGSNPGGPPPVGGGTPPGGGGGTVTPPTVALLPPAAPVNVQASASGPNQAKVTWAAGSGGGEATSYTITRSDGATATSTTRSTTSAGLAVGTAYTFTVTATNAAGSSPASARSNAMSPSAGSPGAPTNLTLIDKGRGGGTNTEQYYALTWGQADLNGGEFVGYRITETNRKGGSNVRTVTGTQDDGFGGFRCLMPFAYDVRTVTRTPGTTDELVSAPATLTSPNYDCTITMSIQADATGPDTVAVTLAKIAPSIETWPATCDLLFNGVSRWSDKCDSADSLSQISGLDPSTDYRLTLKIDNPHSSKKSSSNTVTVTTPAG